MILSDQSVDLSCLLGFGLFDVKEVEVGKGNEWTCWKCLMVRCWNNFVESLNIDPRLNEVECFLTEASFEVLRGLVHYNSQRQRHMTYESCGVHLKLASNWIF